jgi:hypothetical protein
MHHETDEPPRHRRGVFLQIYVGALYTEIAQYLFRGSMVPLFPLLGYRFLQVHTPVMFWIIIGVSTKHKLTVDIIAAVDTRCP